MATTRGGLEQQNVGIGEVLVSGDANMVLSTHGLGSCVGVMIYDPVARVGGLAHVKLPESTMIRKLDMDRCNVYADLAIPNLIERMKGMGARPARASAVLAGGANVEARITDKTWQVGELNIVACVDQLEKEGLSIHARRVGGTTWRTVRLYLATGQVSVRTGDRDMEVINGPWDRGAVGNPDTGPLVVRDVTDVKRLLSHMTNVVLPSRSAGKPRVEDLEQLTRVMSHLTADLEAAKPKKTKRKSTSAPAPPRVKKSVASSIEDVISLTDRVLTDAPKKSDAGKRSKPKNVQDVKRILSHLTDEGTGENS